MEFDLFSGASNFIEQQTIKEILNSNKFTQKKGLVISLSQAKELFETKERALKENGRIEFGSGVINKIIEYFYDSPYFSKDNYIQTLHDLVDIFYYYKNETLNLLSDDDLLEYMRDLFDHTCQGSIELLAGRELDKLARNIRYGYPYDYSEDMELEEEDAPLD